MASIASCAPCQRGKPFATTSMQRASLTGTSMLTSALGNTVRSMLLPLPGGLKHHPQITVLTDARHRGTLKVEPEARGARTHNKNCSLASGPTASRATWIHALSTTNPRRGSRPVRGQARWWSPYASTSPPQPYRPSAPQRRSVRGRGKRRRRRIATCMGWTPHPKVSRPATYRHADRIESGGGFERQEPRPEATWVLERKCEVRERHVAANQGFRGRVHFTLSRWDVSASGARFFF